MSKILSATCQGGIVSIEQIPHSTATILSKGVGSSEGVAILEGEKQTYVANTTPDLETTLEKLIAVLQKLETGLGKVSEGLDKIKTVLNTHDTAGFLIGATAGVPYVPTSAADIAGIGTAKTGVDTCKSDLATIRGDLNTLKGNLK